MVMQSAQESAGSKVLLQKNAFEKGGLNIVACVAILVGMLEVGIEIDHGRDLPVLFLLLRTVMLVLLVLEVATRLYVFGGFGAFYKNYLNWLDTVVLICACLGVSGGGLLWNVIVLRCARFLRIAEIAGTLSESAELWMVLSGVVRAAKPLLMFLALILLILFMAASVARAFVTPAAYAMRLVLAGTTTPRPGRASGLPSFQEVGPMILADCAEDAARLRLSCLDVDSYFGNIPQSMLTMFQVATLDSWARNVIRPLLTLTPGGAMVLIVFAVVTFYGVFSLGVGVLVWASIELARGHGDHHTKKDEIEARKIVMNLAEYYSAMLEIADRNYLELNEFKESLEVAPIRAQFVKLNLPFEEDMIKLYRFVDKRDTGRMTVPMLCQAIMGLKLPARRFDHAKLSATMAGAERYCERLEMRSSRLVSKVSHIVDTLGSAFVELTEHADGEAVNTWVPEVGLRKLGKMETTERKVKQRYTEEGEPVDPDAYFFL